MVGQEGNPEDSVGKALKPKAVLHVRCYVSVKSDPVRLSCWAPLVRKVTLPHRKPEPYTPLPWVVARQNTEAMKIRGPRGQASRVTCSE